MPWTATDSLRLHRAARRYPTDTEAAKALGLPPYALSRYLSGRRKPHGNLAETALRERIQHVLSMGKKSLAPTSTKDAQS
jgi:hypothetical protein